MQGSKGLTIDVSAPQVVATAAQRRERGLDFWIDGTMGILRHGDETLVISPNGPRLARQVLVGCRSGADLGSNLIDAVSESMVPIEGLPGDVDHASGGPLYRDPETGLVLLVYHGEWFHEGDDQDYYSFLGLAVSEDRRVFRDLGPIITSHVDRHDVDRPRPVEVGSGALAILDGHMYIYFQDRGFDEVRRNLSVARASLHDVSAATAVGVAPEFWKYSVAGFDAPGIGGRSAELFPVEHGWIGWFDVLHMAQLQKLVLVFSTGLLAPDGSSRYEHRLTASSDGVGWDLPIPITSPPESAEMLYVTLDSGEVDQRVSTTGTFDVYRTRATTEFRWDDASVERVRVSLELGGVEGLGPH